MSSPAPMHPAIAALAMLLDLRCSVAYWCESCGWSGRWRLVDLTARIDGATHRRAHRKLGDSR